MALNYFNEGLRSALAKSLGKDYNPRAGKRVVRAVHNTLVDSLHLDDKEIVPQAYLIRDLGAESIDNLDIEYRLGRKLGISLEETPLTVLGLAEAAYKSYITATKIGKP